MINAFNPTQETHATYSAVTTRFAGQAVSFATRT